MYLSPDQIAASTKNGVDTFYRLAQIQFALIEKIGALNMEAIKTTTDTVVAQSKALLDVRSPQDLFALSTVSPQASVEKLVAYGRSVYEATSTAQAEAGEIVKTQAAELSQYASGSIDTLAKSGLPGSDTAAAALKSALNASQTAYDSLSKSATQASSFIDASIKAATKATA